MLFYIYYQLTKGLLQWVKKVARAKALSAKAFTAM